MSNIAIYKAEREAGLEEKIFGLSAIAYASVIEAGPEFEQISATKAAILQSARAAANESDGLHYLKTLLASTGWNKNDDVFDRQEMWVARATPEDKPFNLEHDCSRIIGHITDNYAANTAGEKLADDAVIDDLPDKFHIITGAVLYKYYDKEELQTEIDTIIGEIAKGKWFVSMECRFRGFDYAVMDLKGEQTILPRNEETAFLTKHLRAYGGEGKYDGYKVGRIMRNITFSGKGLVRKPANAESVIFPANSATASFCPRKNNFTLSEAKLLGYENSSKITLKESHSMANENTELLVEQVKSLKASVDKLEADKAKLEASLKETDSKVVAEKVATLEKAIQTKADENAAVAAKLVEVDKAKAAAEAAKAEAEKSLKEANEQLEALQTKQKAAARLAQAMKVEADEAKAKELVSLFSDLNDEAFTKAMDYQATKIGEYKAAQSAAPKTTGTGVGSKPTVSGGSVGTKKPIATGKTPGVKAPPKGVGTVTTVTSASVDEDEDAAAASVEDETLESVEVDESAAANSNSADEVNDKVEATRASIASFLTKSRESKPVRRATEKK